ALNAVEAAVDLRLHVAVRGHDLAVLDADHDAASRAAEAARGLRPFDLECLDAAGNRLRGGRERDPGGCSGKRCRMGLEQIATVDSCRHEPATSCASTCSKTMFAEITPSSIEMRVSVSPSTPLVGP